MHHWDNSVYTQCTISYETWTHQNIIMFKLLLENALEKGCYGITLHTGHVKDHMTCDGNDAISSYADKHITVSNNACVVFHTINVALQ